MSRVVIPIHSDDHKWGGPDPVRQAHLHIKVFADAGTGSDVTTGDGKFVFAIAEDMDGYFLRRAEIFVSTVGSSITQVQLRNIDQAWDLLSPRVQIDASDFTSKDSAVTAAVVEANSEVLWGELIAIDVDAAGSGAKGLGAILEFAR